MEVKEVGVYEAKTHLPRLLQEVEEGAIVTITRHGKPVARLVPVRDGRPDVRLAIAELRALSERNSLGGLTLRELIDEGRRR